MNKKTIQDFFLSCKECVLENPRNFYGCFTLGPFQNSQSLTVANALRRTLLSEIYGIAITNVEIDGVDHEYCTLPGIRESVLDILLNFKQIVIKKTSPVQKPLFGYLNVRGPGIIRASDFKLPPMIQCVDPDQYIATLNENGKLILKFKIEDFQTYVKNKEFSEKFLNIQKLDNFEIFQGKENRQERIERESNSSFPRQSLKTISSFHLTPQNENSSSKETKSPSILEIPSQELKNVSQTSHRNFLWVDPLFHPILKVNYVIEHIEPIQKNIPNQIIIIELWTNGSIHPRKALYEVLSYLKKMFEKLEAMRFINYQFTSTVFESEITNTKFLKNFEYDYNFSPFLKEKDSTFSRNMNSRNMKFCPEEIKEIQRNYILQLKEKEDGEFFSFPIETLNLPIRIQKCLRKNNFQTIGDLMKTNKKKLKMYSGIGNFSIAIIQKSLADIGLEFF